jgi:PIN domain nuclease of toxin-antitoxin system
MADSISSSLLDTQTWIWIMEGSTTIRNPLLIEKLELASAMA